MKYVYLVIETTQGTYSHWDTSVHSIKDDENPEKWAKNYLKNFYGEDDEDEPFDEDEEVVFFDLGILGCEIKDFRVISKEHYEVLSQYISGSSVE